MKNMSKKLSHSLSAMLLFLSLSAYGQWIGPDLTQASQTGADIPDVSPRFRVKALAVLDAIDTLNEHLDKGENTKDARDVLELTLGDLMVSGQSADKENSVDPFFQINIFRRATVVYVDSLYPISKETIGRNPVNENDAASGFGNKARLALEVNQECSLDLRLRLSKKNNPKCEEAVKRLMITAPRVWIGPNDGVHDGRIFAKVPSLAEKLAIEDNLNHLDKFLDALRNSSEKSKEKNDLAFEDLQKNMARMPTMSVSADDQEKTVFLLNIFLQSMDIMFDSMRHNMDLALNTNRLYWDNVALAKDKACISDIRKRLNGETDPSCTSLLKQLYGLK